MGIITKVLPNTQGCVIDYYEACLLKAYDWQGDFNKIPAGWQKGTDADGVFLVKAFKNKRAAKKYCDDSCGGVGNYAALRWCIQSRRIPIGIGYR